MQSTTTNNSHQTNYQSLKTAILPIRQYLENYIASLNNQPIAKTSNIQFPHPILPTLAHICTTFNLSDFEQNILLFCIGIEIDPSLEYLCIKASGNPQRAYPAFSLALEIFPNADWNALTPESPLRYWQLIELSQSQTLTKSALKIDENILHYLAGAHYHDSRIGNIIKPQPPEILEIPLSIPQLKIVQEITENWLKKKTNKLQNTQNPNYFILQLCGKDKDSKEAIASIICTTLNLKPQLLSLNHLPIDTDSLNLLITRWQRQAILTNSALLIEAEQIDTENPLILNTITEIVENSNTPLIITTKDKIHFPKRHSIIYDIPELTRLEQLAMWQESLGEIADKMNGKIEELVSHFNLSSKAIITASSQIKRNSEISGNIPSIAEQLWYICRTTSRPQLDQLAERIETVATWEDLILPEAEKKTLQSIITQVRRRLKVYESWGLGNKIRRGLAINALFQGTSGTGKTMAAEVIGNTLKLDVYRIYLSTILSKYIGETEKNLQRIFEVA